MLKKLFLTYVLLFHIFCLSIEATSNIEVDEEESVEFICGRHKGKARKKHHSKKNHSRQKQKKKNKKKKKTQSSEMITTLSIQNPSKMLPVQNSSNEVRDFLTINANKKFTCPVSLAKMDSSKWFVANYSEIFFIDINDGSVEIIQPPSNIDIWCPTGLYYLRNEKKLFVANYVGHDVLVFNYNEGKLVLEARITHPLMKSPENVCVSPNGSIIYVADYDSHYLFALSTIDYQEIWKSWVPNAHGVTCDKNYVYVTSLGVREIRKYDHQGNLLNAISGGDISVGWEKDHFIWPTSLGMYHDHVIVSDAHTGRISILDSRLAQMGTFGGNGPGADLFNMPYCTVHDSEDDTFVIADTFKHRVVKYMSDGRLHSLIAFDAGFKRGNFETNDRFYQVYINRSYPFFLNIPGINKNNQWFVSYNCCVSQSGNYLQTSSQSFFSSLVYFLYHESISVNGEEYHILGSSQGGQFLIINSKGWYKCFKNYVFRSGTEFFDNFGNKVDFSHYAAIAKESFDLQEKQSSLILQDQLTFFT